MFQDVLVLRSFGVGLVIYIKVNYVSLDGEGDDDEWIRSIHSFHSFILFLTSFEKNLEYNIIENLKSSQSVHYQRPTTTQQPYQKS